MTSVYYSDAHLKAYSAITKNGKSVVKIELETADPYVVASILRQLDEIDTEQKAGKKKKPEPEKKAAQLALPAPALALPYFPEER